MHAQKKKTLPTIAQRFPTLETINASDEIMNKIHPIKFIVWFLTRKF